MLESNRLMPTRMIGLSLLSAGLVVVVSWPVGLGGLRREFGRPWPSSQVYRWWPYSSGSQNGSEPWFSSPRPAFW